MLFVSIKVLLKIMVNDGKRRKTGDVDKTLRVRQCLKKRQVQVCFTPFPFEGAAMLITPFHGKRFLFFSGKGERGGGVIFVNKVLL